MRFLLGLVLAVKIWGLLSPYLPPIITGVVIEILVLTLLCYQFLPKG